MNSHQGSPGQSIKVVSNIRTVISNPRQGDWIFVDIDELLLLTGLDKLNDPVRLTEAGLDVEISRLQNSGVKVIGLTARFTNSDQVTLSQLKQVKIELDKVLHAPNKKTGNEKTSIKGVVLKQFIESSEIKPKRIYMLDDQINNLFSVLHECQSLNIPIYCKHYVPLTYLPYPLKQEAYQFPENLDEFHVVKSLGGGTESVYEIQHNETKERLVIKFGAHEHANNMEIICQAIYAALDVTVPPMRIFHRIPKHLAIELNLNSPYRIFKVCPLIETAQLDEQEAERLIMHTACKDYSVHAWLGNIDVAKYDNFIIDRHGTAYLVDAGDNFIFRALGKAREESPWLVSEIDSLKDGKTNRLGGTWFGKVDTATIAKQLHQLKKEALNIETLARQLSSDLELEASIREQFLACLSERFDVLITRFCREPQRFAKDDKKPHPDKTAAGVMTYTNINDVPHILLGKRSKHEWFDNSGGKSEMSDADLTETAIRETRQETGKTLNYSETFLHECPSHDLVTGDGSDQYLYRMYLAEHPYVEPAKIFSDEHTEFLWVPVESILASVDSNKTAVYENQEVFIVSHGDTAIPLFPPLCAMLRQLNIQSQLKEISFGRPLKRNRTLGYADGEIPDDADGEYTPLPTPVTRKREIAKRVLEKGEMHKSIKALKRINHELITCEVEELPFISQGELHLKSVLGEEYWEGNLEHNVRVMFKNYFSAGMSEQAQIRYIKEYVRIFTTEKQNKDKFYFYHGCDDRTAHCYMAYSFFYDEIFSDRGRPAFRIYRPHLKKLSNIIEFIAHFTKDGSISDKSEGYNEYGLCVNVFPFGNHKRFGSCSTSYEISNSVARHFDLRALLNDMFRPFNATQEWMSKLFDLYEKYANQMQGAYYQIGIPLEDASQMAHMAHGGGPLNPLHLSDDPTVVMQELRQAEQQGNLASHAKYIRDVQARLLTPPDLPMSVNQIRSGTISDEDKAAYETELRMLMRQLVQQMISKTSVYPSEIHGIFRVYKNLVAINQLPQVTTESDAYLLGLINQNKIETLRSIIESDPAVLDRMLEEHNEYSGKSSQYVFHYDKAIHKTVYFRILFKCECLAADLGIEFERRLLKTRINWETFDAIMKKLKPENKLTFLLSSDVSFCIEKQLQEVVSQLPELDRVVFLHHYIHFLHLNNNASAIMMLIPENQHLALFKAHYMVMGGMENSVDLKPLLHFYNKQNGGFKEEFYKFIVNNISNFRSLFYTIQFTPQQDRQRLIEQYDFCILTDQHIGELIDWVSPYELEAITLRHTDKISRAYYLYDIVKALRSHIRLKLILAHVHIIQTDFTGSLYDFLQLLSPDERVVLAKAYRPFIMCEYNLCIVLPYLTPAEAFSCLLEKMDILKELHLTGSLLRFIPTKHHTECYRAHALVCVHASIFMDSLKHIAEPDAFEIVLSRVNSIDFSGYHLSSQYRVMFMRFTPDNQAIIAREVKPSSFYMVDVAMDCLPDSERAEYILKYSNLIENVSLLMTLLNSCEQHDKQVGVVLKLTDKLIGNVIKAYCLRDIADIIPFMAKTDRMKYISRFKHLFNTAHNEDRDIDRIRRSLDGQDLITFNSYCPKLETRESDHVLRATRNTAAKPAAVTLLGDQCATRNTTAKPAAVTLLGDQNFSTLDLEVHLNSLKSLTETDILTKLLASINDWKFNCCSRSLKLTEFFKLLSAPNQIILAQSFIPGDDYSLYIANKYLPEAQRVAHIMKYVYLIECVYHLNHIVVDSNSNQIRHELVESVSDKLLSGEIKTNCMRDIADVITYMKADDRKNYLIANRRHIKDINSNQTYVSKIRDALKEEDKSEFDSILQPATSNPIRCSQ